MITLASVSRFHINTKFEQNV